MPKKKIVNSDIYNISQLVNDVKSVFIPDETDETLAIGTYGYIGAIESHRLQTQIEMTGEICNEVFPSRARLNRNIITHAIMTNINDINAIPAKMTAFLAIKETDIYDYFDAKTNSFIIDRDCPLYIGDFEFHLEYDIKLKRINIKNKKTYAYTAQYIIPSDRDVPTSTIDSTNQYLNPPVVVMLNNEAYIYLTVVLAQVEYQIESKKLVTSNIIDNKTINFEFENQLAYFEVHCIESDENFYLMPVFEGSSIPVGNSRYYCWYQYIDTNLIRVRFDRHSYMPGLNATVECLIKTCKGNSGNFTYGEDTYIELESEKYKYKGITCLLTPISDSTGGKDRKSKKELQSLIPKEVLSRGSLTTITDLNNYFSMLDSEYGRIVIQKKIDNQIERVYYAYFVAKDQNNDIIPSNTVDIEVKLDDFIKSSLLESDSPRYFLQSGKCFRLDSDGIARINNDPLINKNILITPHPVIRGQIVIDEFSVRVNHDAADVDNASVRIDIDDNYSTTNTFPSKYYDERFRYHKIDSEVIVKDYIQMGVGKIYVYTCEYITRENKSVIKATDLGLDCFDFIEGNYTINNITKNTNSLPIVIYNLPINTKILFEIKVRLNNKARGIISFINGTNIYKLHQKYEVRLSEILKKYKISGKVTNATTEYGEFIEITDVGNIIDNNDKELPSPLAMSIENPFVKKVVKESDLPPVKDRMTNEWYWVILKSIDINSIKKSTSFNIVNGTDSYFTLTVCEEKELPPIEERPDNNWYYVVTYKDENQDNTIIPFSASSDKHRVHVITEDELPPVGERGDENDWYLIITDSEIINNNNNLTGKDYNIKIIKNFKKNPIYILVTVDNNDIKIAVDQDRFNVENGIFVSENNKNTFENMYLTYVPIIEQDKWPDKLELGDIIHYKYMYKSTNKDYSPDIIVNLSKGLEYVSFSNYITYPNKSPIQFEPVEVTTNIKKDFIYTNPYAININKYRLYSSFYMMSIEENPYLKFMFVNDNSNVQFIATNIQWKRDFYGDNKKYKLAISFMQSVQDDLGLIVDTGDSENTATPLVKAIVVFYRNNAPYRYRSLELKNFDKTNYTFNFEQSFESADIFDNENNIKIMNTRIIHQSEYIVTFNDNENCTIFNANKKTIKTILDELNIPLDGEISEVTSSNRSALDVIPCEANSEGIPTNYEIQSFIDFKDPITITIIQIGANEIKLTAKCSQFSNADYGFFSSNTKTRIYSFCRLSDGSNKIPTKEIFDACPNMEDWTLTNEFEVANGVTLFHNYSEIMGSKVIPYGKKYTDIDNNTVMELEGYRINSVPMLGYDYCQDETLVQNAINALNYRKAYIDNAAKLLENSFGIDFKLFNTYGPSRIYYIIKDSDKDGMLDNETKFISRVNLTLNFRVKLISRNDSYTKNNIIKDIKEYIEDLDDIGQLHIPNLITQITNSYKEQVSYFEYLGFNEYGADIQHIYKIEDNNIPIHTAPEFLCINNVILSDGNTVPDINIYISEI